MSNDRCLANLKQSMALQSAGQLKELDLQILAIKQLHASQHLLRSSATIKKVITSCASFLEHNVEFFFNEIGKLPLGYENKLNAKLESLFSEHYNDCFKEAESRLIQVIKLAGGERVEQRFWGSLAEVKDLLYGKALNRIDQLTLSMDAKTRLSTSDKWFISIELSCLLGVAYLAGKWSVDQSGNYEPFIIFWGVISAALEVVRRYLKKGAT